MKEHFSFVRRLLFSSSMEMAVFKDEKTKIKLYFNFHESTNLSHLDVQNMLENF